jgi:hypothetical protein
MLCIDVCNLQSLLYLAHIHNLLHYWGTLEHGFALDAEPPKVCTLVYRTRTTHSSSFADHFQVEYVPCLVLPCACVHHSHPRLPAEVYLSGGVCRPAGETISHPQCRLQVAMRLCLWCCLGDHAFTLAVVLILDGCTPSPLCIAGILCS